MTTITVPLTSRAYPIVVATGWRGLSQHLRRLNLPEHGCLISHHRLLRRYGAGVLAELRRSGWRIDTLTIPESETAKSFRILERLTRQIARQAAGRVPVLFALGGGVVGDVTGFAAAVFRRGVPCVQLPTTLLAQVDSAIGGKTGIDLPEGKNLVGAFHQPRLVWNNTAVLASLPHRQRQSGLSELIKYGVIGDPALFAFLERHPAQALALAGPAAQRMVVSACRIKAGIVAQDERETRGIRACLNFGHTIGHALEAATGYVRWTHGEAIAIGMCAAAWMAAATGRCGAELARRIEEVVRAYELPVTAGGVSRARVREALRYDKKFVHGRPRWVLPTRLGRVIVTEAVPSSVVAAARARDGEG